MKREYTVPDKRVDEDNWQYCQRVADAIPPEAIVRALVDYLSTRGKTRGFEAWSFIGKLLGHGSGVSSAIVEKCTTRQETGEGKDGGNNG
jgi:hypothetical protein